MDGICNFHVIGDVVCNIEFAISSNGIAFGQGLLIEFLEFCANLLQHFITGSKDMGSFAVERSEKIPGLMVVVFMEEFVNLMSKFFHAILAILIEAAADGVMEGS